ncbi:MAG: MauE/DoxX family redox-associated membrane protein [Planctomycetota bacterium]
MERVTRLIHHSVAPLVAPFVAAVAPDQQLSARVFRLVMLLARVALGGVLLYAGIVKVPNTAVFERAIANFDILPPLGNWIVALTLPWAEIVIGLLLICGLWLRYSAAVTVLMFLGFGGAVLLALARGIDIECGCFGTDDYERVGVKVLAIEAAMIAAGVLVFIFPRHSLALLRLPKKVVHVVARKTLRLLTLPYKKEQI